MKQSHYRLSVLVTEDAIRVQGSRNLFFDRQAGLRERLFTDELEFALAKSLDVLGLQFSEDIADARAHAIGCCYDGNDIVQEIAYEVEVFRPMTVMAAMVIIDVNEQRIVALVHWDREPIENQPLFTFNAPDRQPAYAFNAAGELV